MLCNRAPPDIISSLEVRKIFKIQTVWKPDIFLLEHRTFNTFENTGCLIVK